MQTLYTFQDVTILLPSTQLLVQTTLCQFSCETATYSVNPLKSIPGINQY